MTVPIIIREVEKNEKGFSATVQFGPEGAPYEIEVSDPFSEQEEARLEWYFEEWLKFPFTDQVPAEQAKASIRTYGEAMFAQVFRDNPDAYHEYRELRAQDISLEIIGSPEFHALHWEALHDPNDARPLAVDAVVVRKNLKPAVKRAKVQPAPQLRVLLITARPAGVQDVSYRTISRPLVEALETGKIPAQIDMVRPGTFEALVNHLEEIRDEHGEGYYHIIHLDMHGALLTFDQYQKFSENHQPNRYTFRGDYAHTDISEYPGLKAFLFFEDPDGKAEGSVDPVSADDLAGLLNMHHIPMVILNAGQSGKQAGVAETSLGSRLLDAGAQLVMTMSYSVTVSAVKLLMTTLYRQLLAGRDPAVAIRRARLELYNDKLRRAAFGQEISLEDWLLPVIYQNRAPGFDQNTFQGQVVPTFTDYAPPRTTYRFVGRDIDILQVERLLLHQRNLLLIHGLGGAGKTTLLHHLGWWWQKTRFVKQVFYFGYDVKAYHLSEIVSKIGQELGLSLTGIAADDRAVVLRVLKSTRYLLILDNLESITGEGLAVRNILPPAAQTEIRSFLQELVDTKSLALLGSRGYENWLRPDPLRDGDVYDLPWLDSEAQSDLAEAILKACQAPRYPELAEHQNDFKRLLKLLGGYPLAMEVVLSNLAQATPAQIIERLQAADVDLDNKSESAQKTDSILKCIHYSHSNLSEEAQTLLLCLAPFTGVFNTGWLEQYAELLKAQPALADLPFDQWQAILQEAVNWGLLRPHKDLAQMGYLSLQPILPYFLKTRLNDEAQAARKQAIEAAFREHYNGIGGSLSRLIDSKEPQERQMGQILAGVEYENLLTSTTISLQNASSFIKSFGPIEAFLDSQKLTEQIEDLCEWILKGRSAYSDDQISGKFGTEFLAVNNRLAGAHLKNKNYREATDSYKRNLEIIYELQPLPLEQRKTFEASTLNQLGIVAQEQRQWQAAEKYLKDALQIYIEFNDRYEQAKTLHNLGIVAQEQRQWQEAEKYYKDALEIDIEFNDRYEKAGTLHQLGMVAQEQRQWQAAEKYYKDALEIYIEFNDRYSQASTLHQLGRVAQEQRQWQEAEKYYKDALRIDIEFNDRYEQAKTLHQLGHVAQEQRQWQEAEKYYKDALRIDIEFNDRYEQAKTLHQLGRVAQEQQQLAVAEGYYKEALQIQIDFNDRYSQASTLRQLGRVAQEQLQLAVAEGYYKEALQIQIDFNDRYEQATTLHQLGIVAQEQLQWAAAEGYYQEALKVKIDFNDRFEQATILHQLGMVAQEQRQWQAAERYYKQALQIYIEFNNRFEQARTLQQLGMVAQEQRQWQAAENYLKDALQIYIEFKDPSIQAIIYHQLTQVSQELGKPADAKNYYQKILATFRDMDRLSIFQIETLTRSDNIRDRLRAAKALIPLILQDESKIGKQENQIRISNNIRTDQSIEVRSTFLESLFTFHQNLPRELSGLIAEYAQDPADSIRATLARWIIVRFDEVGATYDALLKELTHDNSMTVRQVIVETIKQRFELLPVTIRVLASTLVGEPIEVQLVKGGGMMVGDQSELVMRITNQSKSTIDKLLVEIIQPSAEYQVESDNPVISNTLFPGQVADIHFYLKMNVAKQIAVNYKINGELRAPPLYINAINDNPYVYGDPIKAGFTFFGREEELEDIVQAITKPTKQDILLVGERRAGKTSLIYQLMKRLGKPFIPVDIVLNTCEQNTESLLAHILNKTLQRLIEHNLLMPDYNDHNVDFVEFEVKIRQMLHAAKAKLSDVRIVLLLDEADCLLKISKPGTGIRGIVDAIMHRSHIDERPQNILRAALQSAYIGSDLSAVVAGTSDLSTYYSQASSPFFNHFRLKHLKPFSSDEIYELITKPASVLGYSYSPDVIEHIIHMSGGQPFYCQALCYEAFGNALKNDRKMIIDQDVDIAENKIVNDQFSAYLSVFWNRTNKMEKRFLSMVARGDDTSAFSHQQIKRLLDWGIVVQPEGLNAFAGGLVRTWTQMALGRRELL